MAQNFTQLQHINSKCSAVALCPKRDILGTVLADGTFAVYRFSVSNRTQERLLPHPDGNVHPKSDPLPAASATALGWSPDGGTLAVGYADGAIVLVDIESNYCRLAASDPSAAFSALGSKAAAAAVRWHTAPIVHLAWGAQQAPANASDESFVTRETRAATSAAMGDCIRRLLPPPDIEGSAGLGGGGANNRTNNSNSGGSSSSKGNGVSGSGDDDEEGSAIGGKDLVVLFAADATGCVSLSAGGTFLVQQFQVATKLGVAGPLSVTSASFSPTLSSLTLCCNDAPPTTSASPRPSVVEVPTRTLWSRRHEIQMLASKMRAVCSLVHTLSLSLDRIESLWLDAAYPLGAKLGQLSSLLSQEYGRQGPLGALPSAELLACLTHGGGPSPPLELWLSKQFIAEPLVLRMARGAEAACVQAEEVLENGTTRALRLLVAYASELHGEVMADEAFGELEALGLSPETSSAFLAAAELACLRAESCAQVLRQGRSRLRLLYKWLRELVVGVTSSSSTTLAVATSSPALTSFEIASLMQVLEGSVQAATHASMEKERETMQNAAALAEDDDDDDGGLGGGSSYKSAVGASSNTSTSNNTTHKVTSSTSSSSAPPTLSVAAKKLLQRRDDTMIVEDLLSISVAAHFQNAPLVPKKSFQTDTTAGTIKAGTGVISAFAESGGENDGAVGSTSFVTTAWGHGVPREVANEALNLRSLRTQAQRLGDYAATLQRAPLTTDKDKTGGADAIAMSLSYQPSVAAVKPAWMLLDAGIGGATSGKEEDEERSPLVTCKVLPHDRSMLTAWVMKRGLSAEEVKDNNDNNDVDEENFDGGDSVCFLKQPEVVDQSEDDVMGYDNDGEGGGSGSSAGNVETNKNVLAARLMWPVGWRVQSLALYGGDVASPVNEDQAESVMVVLQSVTSESPQQLKLATFDLAELNFCSLSAAYAPTNANSAASLINSIMSLNENVQPTLATGEGLKWRRLEDGLTPLAISANGTRGVACLVAASVLTLFDVEEDDEEEEEEEEDEVDEDDEGADESMGGESTHSPSKANSVDGDEDKENNSSMMEDRLEEGPMEESKVEEEDANDMSNSL